MNGLGLTVEEIAVRENVKADKIQDSIDRCREYRNRFTNEMVALKVNEVTLKALEGIPGVFKRGMEAKKEIFAGNTKDGKAKFKVVPDVAMQLKTVETLGKMHDMAQPRVPLVQNNTQFNNTVGGNQHLRGGTSFESRLRQIRAARGMTNHEETIIENAAEADEDQTLAEELAEQVGIDIDEDDDVEDAEETDEAAS